MVEIHAKVVAERDELRAVVETQRREISRLLGERDAAETRREHVDRTLELYARTRDSLPIVGVMCDSIDCKNAIGVVGLRLVDADAIADHAVSIAERVGWKNMGPHRGHLCPKCSKES